MGAKGLRGLNGFHLLAMACWIGGGAALLLLCVLNTDATHGGVRYGINQSIRFQGMVLSSGVKEVTES